MSGVRFSEILVSTYGIYNYTLLSKSQVSPHGAAMFLAWVEMSPKFLQYFSPSSMCTFMQKLQSFSVTWLWRAFMYLSRSCVDVGMVPVNLRASLGPKWRNSIHGGRLPVLFPPLASGQPTQIFEGPFRQSENDSKFEEKLSILRKRKSARSRSAPPSNDCIVDPRNSKVSGKRKVSRAVVVNFWNKPFAVCDRIRMGGVR